MNRQLAWAVSGSLVAVLAAVAVWVSLGSPGAVLGDTPPPPEQRPARGDETIVVEIPSGHTAEQIGDELFRRGVITSSRQFQTLVGLLGYEGRLVVGTYDFEPGMLTMDVIERIRRGVTSEIVVTIPEGWQAAEILRARRRAEPDQRRRPRGRRRRPGRGAGHARARAARRRLARGLPLPEHLRHLPRRDRRRRRPADAAPLRRSDHDRHARRDRRRRPSPAPAADDRLDRRAGGRAARRAGPDRVRVLEPHRQRPAAPGRPHGAVRAGPGCGQRRPLRTLENPP